MKLYSLGLWCIGVWVIGGDFNVIRFRGEKHGISFDLRNMSAFNDWINFFFDLLDYQGTNWKFSWAPGGNSSQMALLDSFLLMVIGRFIIILLIFIIFLYYFLITLQWFWIRVM
jgi:hypothetical protein